MSDTVLFTVYDVAHQSHAPGSLLSSSRCQCHIMINLFVTLLLALHSMMSFVYALWPSAMGCHTYKLDEFCTAAPAAICFETSS